MQTAEQVQAFSNANRIIEKYNLNVDPVVLAIVGPQSSGKSSFVDGTVGFPVSYTHHNTATRRPVEYTLLHDPTFDVPEVYFDGDLLDDYMTLKNQVGAVMQDLDQQQTFSDVPLRIQIRSAYVVNMVITDYPGIITEPDQSQIQDAEVILEMISRLNDQGNVFFIAVVKSTENPDTVEGLNILDTCMGSNSWRSRCAVIVNKWDTYLSQFVEREELLEYLESASSKTFPMVCVSLNPANRYIRSNDTAQDIETKIRGLEEHESQFILGELNRLGINPNGLTRNQRKSYGIGNARSLINNLWKSAMENAFPEVLRILQQRIARNLLQKEQLEIRCADTDPDSMRKLMTKFIQDFRDQFLAFQENNMVKDVRFRKLDTLNDRSLPHHRFNPDLGARTLEKDFESVGTPEWDFFISVDQIVDECSGEAQLIGEEAAYGLKGTTALHRAKKMFFYILASRKFDHYEKNSIYSMSNNTPGLRGNTFDVHKVVSQMVRMEIEKSLVGMDWINDVFMSITDNAFEIVFEYLMDCPIYASVRGLHHIQAYIRDAFRSIVVTQLEGIKSKWRDDVLVYSYQMREDISARKIMSMCCAPMLTTFLPIELYSRPALIIEEDMNLQAPTPQGQYIHSPELQDFVPNQRAVAKHIALTEIAKLFAKYKHFFNIADLIEGGHQNLPPMEKDMINVDLIKVSAYEYYLQTLQVLIFNLESSINYHLIHFLATDEDSVIIHTLTDLVYGLPDEELMDDGIEDARRELAEVTTEQVELEAAERELRTAFGNLRAQTN